MFDDAEAQRLDEQISSLVFKISGLIKRCEQKLKEMTSNADMTKVEQKIRKNVQLRYIGKIKDFTQNLKQVEKAYVQKMADMHGQDYLKYENQNQA